MPHLGPLSRCPHTRRQCYQPQPQPAVALIDSPFRDPARVHVPPRNHACACPPSLRSVLRLRSFSSHHACGCHSLFSLDSRPPLYRRHCAPRFRRQRAPLHHPHSRPRHRPRLARPLANGWPSTSPTSMTSFSPSTFPTLSPLPPPTLSPSQSPTLSHQTRQRYRLRRARRNRRA